MKPEQKVDEVVEMILNYGCIDGAHHKMWVLDQALRMLLGDRYEATIEQLENNGEYEWDTGLAP